MSRNKPTVHPALSAGLLGLSALSAAGAYLVYAKPVPEPELPAQVVKARLQVGPLERSYVAVIPDHLPLGAPLVVMAHGTGQNAASLRSSSGYRLDELAVQHGFAVVYPDAYKGRWQDCRRVGAPRGPELDDSAFIRALTEQLVGEHGLDASKVFAAGFSNGGQLVFMLMTTLNDVLAGAAVIGATYPTPDNRTCAAPKRGLPLLMVNGTADPIVPFFGGEISLFGFQPRGTALSAHDTASYFASLNGIRTPPVSEELQHGPHFRVNLRRFEDDPLPPVAQYIIEGGGHVIAGPNVAFPRLMGATDRELDSLALIWHFFEQVGQAPKEASERQNV